VVLLRALLVAQATRGRWRTEVRAAVAATGRRRPAGTARSESAATTTWSRSAKSTATTTAEAAATTGSRATEPPARSGPEAARAWWTWPSILACTRFADRERPALKRLRIELADDFLRFFTVHELDERKPAWTAGFAIDWHGDVGGLCDGREVGPKIGLARAVGEISDEQTDCQGLLVKAAV
jgi:hypothetical protein